MSHLASVVLLKKINLKSDVVDHSDILLRIHAHLHLVVHGEVGASSLQHVERHLVLGSIIERSASSLTPKEHYLAVNTKSFTWTNTPGFSSSIFPASFISCKSGGRSDSLPCRNPLDSHRHNWCSYTMKRSMRTDASLLLEIPATLKVLGIFTRFYVKIEASP